MGKYIYFHRLRGNFWPALEELKPYFFAPPGEDWFPDSGNDTAGICVEGIEGTEHLQPLKGRKDICLAMWGNPDLGVLLQYIRKGGAPRKDWFSKGDMSRIKEWVRAKHATPLPVGLFIPFDKAWLAVKEFMETEGQMPTSIPWIYSDDLPDNTFPDPTVRLPGETR